MTLTSIACRASRQPTVGTTIFTVIGAGRQDGRAINPARASRLRLRPDLVDAAAAAMRAGHNQCPPMTGAPALRQAVSRQVALTTGRRYDADTEITITAGATQGPVDGARAGAPATNTDVLEPCYDSYGPSITLAGGNTLRPLRRAPGAPICDALAQP